MSERDSNLKVLVVEDDPLVAKDIEAGLSQQGYKVIATTGSGEEALEIAGNTSPDCIVMDIGLDGNLDGLETALVLQARAPLPIVFLTALNEEALLQRAKLSHPYGFLLKPFHAEEVNRSIKATVKLFHSEAEHSSESDHEYLSVSETLGPLPELLINLPLFEGLDRGLLLSCLSNATIKEYEGGDVLDIDGEKSSGGFIPLTGRISIVKSTSTGKELIVALIGPGDITGLFFLLNEGLVGYARCQVPSKVLWIPSGGWRDLTKAEPRVFQRLCEAVYSRLCTAYDLASSLAHTRVEDRVIGALLVLLREFGRPSSKSTSEGRIYMTRRELAELTGTTPETAIRVTKQLERDGILDLSRPGIIKIPDTARLNSLSTETK